MALPKGRGGETAHYEAYLTLGRSVPAPYRKFLVLELHSIPAGATLSRVSGKAIAPPLDRPKAALP